MPSAEPTPAGPALRYHQLHLLGRASWGWTILGVLGLTVALFLLQTLLVLPFWSPSDPLTPIGLAMTCVALAAMTPTAAGLTELAHRVPARALASVVGRLRWRWMLTCAGLAVLAIGASLLLSQFLPESGGAQFGSSANDATSRTLAFALVIVLLVPLQAAGEEFAFRGYLTQAFGGAVTGCLSTAVAVAVPAVLFALAHGVQDAPVFIDRLAFGLVAGLLVIRTGGLEAGIALHVLNNGVFFGLSLAFGDIGEALAPVAGTWWLLPGTLVQSLGYLALVEWAARRRGVATSAAQGVLERPRPRV
ncbi:CPBP family intramembrane metalloprotease [Nocardioides humilatus]|uniref:CPBP family intramembrane metalloprotease n=1 Tax=Nocardioides humilatus TaxID=2607660 RepID=A0A5B1LD38_9ACTN|nr:CPBP family intramembrane glutamic endopeptidase [Nocardioides humilatus]KAA1418565.1 CPBP family intramembrane metalloprotease [Nocardioides humilatus]